MLQQYPNATEATFHLPLRAAVPGPDPLAALRHATAAQHARLDSALALGRADAGLEDYARHLAAIRGWLDTLAPCIDRLGGEAARAARLERIAHDLRDCGSAASVDKTPAPQGRALRAADDGSEAFCWGVCYVVEGSALGAQVLYRRLRRALAPHPLRFLAGEAGARWLAFVPSLRAQLRTPPQLRSACAGAVAAFDEFACAAGITGWQR